MKFTIAPFLFAVLLAALPVNAFARDAEGNYTVMGAGLSSCGKVVKEDKENDVIQQANHLWLLGYITAVNAWHYDGKNIAAGTDAHGLYAWALKYCRENPLNDWAYAAASLVRHLENRR
ncbi:MAG: hypothetical protein HAW59_07085 [Betaproteobacteria bacterium]|nr:hypothetical protein [Betaproteobacteria bacterium]